jgi:putative transposase
LKRAYKFLLRPTVGQAQALGEMLQDHRSLYNGALEDRKCSYRDRGVTVRYGEQSGQLKDIRVFDPQRQGRWSFSSQQATLRRLDKAFTAFFRRVKAGQAPGYPRFKGAGRFDTVEFPKDGDGCRWDSTPDQKLTRVRFQGVGRVRVHRHRPVEGRVKTVSVTREGKRWYVVLVCEGVQVRSLPGTGSVVGIDVGVANFLADSVGGFVPNPRYGGNTADRLADAQRALAMFPKRIKAKNRTRRHRAAAVKVAALHGKIRRQRLDHAHKTALDLVRNHDVIAHEKLNIKNMVKTPAPRPNGVGGHAPNGAAAKAGLNRSIHDAGWGNFLRILTAKAASAGRTTIPVDARNTSRTCPECGYVSGENRLEQAVFRCVACGYTGHADTVGALNVLQRAGLVRREAVSA